MALGLQGESEGRLVWHGHNELELPEPVIKARLTRRMTILVTAMSADCHFSTIWLRKVKSNALSRIIHPGYIICLRREGPG